jgi:hypothetical protein
MSKNHSPLNSNGPFYSVNESSAVINCGTDAGFYMAYVLGECPPLKYIM